MSNIRIHGKTIYIEEYFVVKGYAFTIISYSKKFYYTKKNKIQPRILSKKKLSLLKKFLDNKRKNYDFSWQVKNL